MAVAAMIAAAAAGGEDEEEEELTEEERIERALKADPRFTKYIKMTKVGVPVDNICLKLRTEGFTEAEVVQFSKAFGGSAHEEGTGGALAARKQTKQIKGKRRGTMLLHWEELEIQDDEQYRNTVWAAELSDDDTDEERGDRELGDFNGVKGSQVTALEQLFASVKTRREAEEELTADEGEEGEDGAKRPKRRGLFGRRGARGPRQGHRAEARAERRSPLDVRARVRRGLRRDLRGGRALDRARLDPERPEALRAILPTPTELDAVKRAPQADPSSASASAARARASSGSATRSRATSSSCTSPRASPRSPTRPTTCATPRARSRARAGSRPCCGARSRSATS